MRNIIRTCSLGVAALAIAASSATAQFTEDFESYALGQLDGQGGWHGWGGINTTFANVVNTQNHTVPGSQSAELASGADSVHEFTTYTSGRWVVSTWVFLPSNFTGSTYFILMNAYQDAGPWEWGAQLAFDGNASVIRCDCGTAGTVESPLVKNQWVDLRYDIDLDNDTVDVYYNTAVTPLPIATYPWSMGVFGTDAFTFLQIRAVDLYPDPLTSPTVAYFDDIRIEPAVNPNSGTPVCFGDGSGAPCGCGNESAPGSLSGCLNSANVGAALTGTGSADTTADTFSLTAENVINQPGLFFQGNNTIAGGAGALFGDGVRCCGNSVVRIQVVNPPGTTSPATAVMTETATTNGPAGTINPGDTKCYQYWYRDPSGGGVCGNGFNLSNAVSVTWI